MQKYNFQFTSVTLSCIRFISPIFFPVRFGQPSVVAHASLSHLSPSLSKHAFTSVNKSLPVIVPFIDRIAASSSVILKSFVVPRIDIYRTLDTPLPLSRGTRSCHLVWVLVGTLRLSDSHRYVFTALISQKKTTSMPVHCAAFGCVHWRSVHTLTFSTHQTRGNHFPQVRNFFLSKCFSHH